VLFDSQDTVHEEFMKEVCTVNVEYYKGVLDRLISRNRPVRLPLYRSRDFFLLHNNTPAHSAAKIRHFLTQKQVATLNQTPYWTDLFPTPSPLLYWPAHFRKLRAKTMLDI